MVWDKKCPLSAKWTVLLIELSQCVFILFWAFTLLIISNPETVSIKVVCFICSSFTDFSIIVFNGRWRYHDINKEIITSQGETIVLQDKKIGKIESKNTFKNIILLGITAAGVGIAADNDNTGAAVGIAAAGILALTI